MQLKLLFNSVDRIYTFCAIVGAAFLVMMALAVLTSILSRLLGFYISGLAHSAGYLMAASNTLALAYAFREKQHIRITLVISKLSPKAQFDFEKIVLSFSLIICGYVAYYMIRMAYFSWIYNELATGSTFLMLWIPQAIAAFGCSVLCLAIFQELLENVLKLNKEAAFIQRKEA